MNNKLTLNPMGSYCKQVTMVLNNTIVERYLNHILDYTAFPVNGAIVPMKCVCVFQELFKNSSYHYNLYNCEIESITTILEKLGFINVIKKDTNEKGIHGYCVKPILPNIFYLDAAIKFLDFSHPCKYTFLIDVDESIDKQQLYNIIKLKNDDISIDQIIPVEGEENRYVIDDEYFTYNYKKASAFINSLEELFKPKEQNKIDAFIQCLRASTN